MLNQVLREIETAQGSITLSELSRKLEITPTALEGMLQFWVRKGRLQDDNRGSVQASANTSCGDGCTDVVACPFIAKMPQTYSVTAVDG